MYTYLRRSKESYVRMQKERDYHRMHHRRVTQEKNRLIADVKRYNKHTAQSWNIIVDPFSHIQAEGSLQPVWTADGTAEDQVPGETGTVRGQ